MGAYWWYDLTRQEQTEMQAAYGDRRHADGWPVIEDVRTIGAGGGTTPTPAPGSGGAGGAYGYIPPSVVPDPEPWAEAPLGDAHPDTGNIGYWLRLGRVEDKREQPQHLSLQPMDSAPVNGKLIWVQSKHDRRYYRVSGQGMDHFGKLKWVEPGAPGWFSTESLVGWAD